MTAKRSAAPRGSTINQCNNQPAVAAERKEGGASVGGRRRQGGVRRRGGGRRLGAGGALLPSYYYSDVTVVAIVLLLLPPAVPPVGGGVGVDAVARHLRRRQAQRQVGSTGTAPDAVRGGVQSVGIGDGIRHGAGIHGIDLNQDLVRSADGVDGVVVRGVEALEAKAAGQLALHEDHVALDKTVGGGGAEQEGEADAAAQIHGHTQQRRGITDGRWGRPALFRRERRKNLWPR